MAVPLPIVIDLTKLVLLALTFILLTTILLIVVMVSPFTKPVTLNVVGVILAEPL